MAGGIAELIDMLYDMIEDARGMPLGPDKCILERDKALDLLDEIRAQYPMELAEAKKLLGARTEYIAAAKREGEQLRRQAEEQAKQLVAQDTTLATARQKANELIGRAEERTRELRRTANDYCEDTLRRTEEAVAAAYDEIKRQRAKFRAVSAQESGAAAPDRRANVPYDVEADNGP